MKKDSLNLVEYNINRIREILLNYTKKHYKSILTDIVQDIDWLYSYYASQWYTNRIIQSSIAKIYLKPPNKEGEKIFEYVSKAIYNDTDKVVLDAAAVAWLTIDDFKWHNTRSYLVTSKNLNYGLILKCYTPIVYATSFLACLWTEEMFKSYFNLDDHKEALDYISFGLTTADLSYTRSEINTFCHNRLGYHPRLSLPYFPFTDDLYSIDYNDDMTTPNPKNRRNYSSPDDDDPSTFIPF